MNGEGGPRVATETASQPAKADVAPSLGQMMPIGPHPDASTLLVGAVLWAPSRSTGLLRLSLVQDEDIEDPALATVLAAARSLIYARQPHGPQLVMSELRRTGKLTDLVARRLESATISGAAGMAVRPLAAAVVADSMHRRVESAGHALSTSAHSAAEETLGPLVERAARSISDCADRLRALRGEGE